MDADLEAMTHGKLIEEVKKLRAGIHAHRDASGHNFCWYHPYLWNLVPEQGEHQPFVPD